MMVEQELLVQLQGAGVQGHDGLWRVRGVDMTVHRGEIVTLIGPNGSGKSTTARVALGLLAADEGKSWRRPRLRVAYVPQKLAIDWTIPLPVSRFMSLTSPLSRQQRRAALERTGVAALEAREVRELSGGEYQRVLLARAIARRPELLVLDEPVQGVDTAGEVRLYELIRGIRDELGCGILLISHDLHVVMADTDQVLCLNGHVCCSGSPVTVAADPAYRELFGERAAATLAVYEHHHDHVHLSDGRVEARPRS